MDIVSMWILAIILMVACLILAIGLLVVTKRYVDLAIKVKGISREEAYKECGLISKYTTAESGSGDHTVIEYDSNTTEYNPVEDLKYEIYIGNRNPATGIGRIVVEEGSDDAFILDAYEDGNDILFVLIDELDPKFHNIDFVISKYLETCGKIYKNVYFFSDYDFHMYNVNAGYYTQMLNYTFEIDNFEKSEFVVDGYCLCRVHIMRECELVEGATVHSYFQNVLKPYREGEGEMEE